MGGRGCVRWEAAGEAPEPYTPPATPAGRKINTSDPDSRRVTTPQGYLQGYNAQSVVTDKQIVLAAEANAETADFGHLEPMLDATLGELEAAGINDRPAWSLPTRGSGTPSRWTRSSTAESR